MSISFNGIPTTLRVPFAFIEFDNSKAQQGPAVQPFTTLLVGQKLAGGTATPLTLYSITSEAQARTLFGAGSILHAMASKYLDNDKITALKAIAQDDVNAGVAATGKLTFSGTATANGTIHLYIGGRKISVAVETGDTDDDVSAAVVAAIQADALCYVSAVVDGTNANESNLTFNHKGELGNELDVRFNYLETESFPAGISATVTAMSGGTTNPDFAAVVAVLPEEHYNTVVCNYSDATNFGKIDVEMEDRFGPVRQLDGRVFMGRSGTFGALTSFGGGKNSKHVVVVGYKNGLNPPWEWASVVAGQASKSAQADPARPIQRLPMVGILEPKAQDLFTLEERNLLLYDGISTFNVVGGQVQIERLITTYQLNAAGAADISYLNVETLYTLSYLRYSFRVRMLSRFPRHKLANDGVRFGAGQPIVTPATAKAEALLLFDEWQALGLVEAPEQFARDIVVQRSAQDPDRLDFLLPPDLINQMRIFGAQIQFLL